VLKVAPRSIVIALAGLLVIANTFNIAADLVAMGSALSLVIGGLEREYAFFFAAASMLLQVFLPYRQYASVLRLLTLCLFTYVATAFTVDIPWSRALWAAIWPRLTLSPDFLMMVVAVLGTTISPYLFYWQAAQEVEEMRRANGRRPLKDRVRGGHREIDRIRVDTIVGMMISNIIAFFIVLTTAAVLNSAGVTNIQSASQAAEALRPLAGDLTFLLFALGIIGTGLLAVPVLAGSAAYCVAETFGWPATLDAKAPQAIGFYTIIVAAIAIGFALGFSSLDPIRMLIWSAVLNGVVAVPVMAAMMLIVRNRNLMGRFKGRRWLIVLGWSGTILMAMAVAAMIWSFFKG
jgi:Mn2+/Fe2+ NRAMP family transporter